MALQAREVSDALHIREKEEEPLDGKIPMLVHRQSKLKIFAVLDFPQLYSKPSAEDLFSILSKLVLQPPSWEATNTAQNSQASDNGVARYLTGIISSSLSWIENDDDKEKIWQTAAQRLSERSGRSGMGAMSRTFAIPLRYSQPIAIHGIEQNNLRTSSALHSDLSDTVNIAIYEPALTGDNLGLKTWGSSYQLAKRLCVLKTVLPAALSQTPILELGAGTGLVGLAAAAVLGAHVLLTDLPEICPNLRHNININAPVIEERGGKAEAAVLDWSDPLKPDSSVGPWSPSYLLILAADPIYTPEHPRLLVHAIENHLSRDRAARVVVEMPIRDGYQSERADFKQRMLSLGLRITDEGEETGFDDWAVSQAINPNQLLEVVCWWSVWAWE
jgi:predicted nicotinamide N-methyase